MAQAQSADFTLSAAPEITETGFLQHLLPRFSLKHGVRITQIEQNGEVVLGTNGIPVFVGLDTIWHISSSDAAGPELFMQWLLSDIGKRTIDAFQKDGAAVFIAQTEAQTPAGRITFDGDPVRGEKLSLLHCGRCHVINTSNRMNGMEQTPSFAVMRTFADWQNRFGTFYVLNPHPSFTQVADVTLPFDASLPPAIVPIEITQTELDHILSYVAIIAPADLGAPLQNQ